MLGLDEHRGRRGPGVGITAEAVPRLATRALVAHVADAVAVAVLLIANVGRVGLHRAVGHAGAVVDHVGKGVAVRVGLFRVEDGRDVVLAVDDPVFVAIAGLLLGLRALVLGAEVAEVAYAVAVFVGLVGVRGLRAVVALVPDAVAVFVLLLVVPRPSRVVAGIAELIVVGVGLVGVRDLRAVVAGVAHAIAVLVGLIRVRDPRAVVAGVADPVAVRVALIRVLDRRAVVQDLPVAVAVEDGRDLGQGLLFGPLELRLHELPQVAVGRHDLAGGDPISARLGRELEAPCVYLDQLSRLEPALVEPTELAAQPSGLLRVDLLAGLGRRGGRVPGAFRGRSVFTPRGTPVIRLLLPPAARDEEQRQQEPQRGVLLHHGTPPFNWVVVDRLRRPVHWIPRAARRWAMSPRQAGGIVSCTAQCTGHFAVHDTIHQTKTNPYTILKS